MAKKPCAKLLRSVPSLFLATLLLGLPLGCTQEKSTESSTEEQGTQVSESQEPPEPSSQQEAEPAPEPQEQPRRDSSPTRPRQPSGPAPSSVPAPPPAPERIALTVPEGTQLKVKIDDALDSGTSQAGDQFQATLMDPVVVGDRVALPAGSTISGAVSDVIPAKKGLKESGGSLTLSFDRITTPGGDTATMNAALSQVAKSTKKKAGTIGGSAAGGALLGKILGGSTKDAAIGAVVGGAIGTGIAAGTKGTEMKIEAGTEMTISLQQPLTLRVKR